jgi:hypothetical protein
VADDLTGAITVFYFAVLSGWAFQVMSVCLLLRCRSSPLVVPNGKVGVLRWAQWTVYRVDIDEEAPQPCGPLDYDSIGFLGREFSGI